MTRLAILALPVFLGFGVVSSSAFAATDNAAASDAKVDADFYRLFAQLKDSNDSITGSAQLGAHTVKSTVSGSGLSVVVLDSRGTQVGAYKLAPDGRVTQSGEMKDAGLSVNKTSSLAEKFKIVVSIDCEHDTVTITVITNRGTFVVNITPIALC